MLNYFELMSVPQAFDLDIDQLQQHLRSLQTQFHPDSQVKSNNDFMGLNNLSQEQISAIINEAYQTLANPAARATHLLALQGLNQSITNPIRDLEFLDEAMNFRIELDEANNEQLNALQSELDSWLKAISEEFKDDYSQLATLPTIEDSDKQTILSLVQKLQFLVKLDADIAKKRDELAAENLKKQQNDDDLYV